MPSNLPILAYCVFSAEYKTNDTTDALVALLAAGAAPTDIPKDMWENYVETPKTTELKVVSLSKKKIKDEWCKPEFRKVLCRTLTVLQRYYLWKASQLARPTEVTEQVAQAFDIRELFEIHFHIVGQFPAAQQVINHITSHYLTGSQRPLVLLFAGPSGHGKTELACRMGALLSLDIHHVDCTAMKHETDIFGPKYPYRGYDIGSPLNNFLDEHTGGRSVVFLDEFDKTTDEVRKAMLLTLDSGLYINRKDGKRLDCSKTIWIMATNLGEEQIKKFWDENLQNVPEERHLYASLKALHGQLKHVFIQEFGAPVTGRVSSVVPFLPFTANEQAVVAYTFVRKLRNEVRKKIDIKAERFLRHIHLNLLDDGQIVRHLVAEGYVMELGARSLEGEVARQVEQKLSTEFLKGRERIEDEVDEKRLFRYDVRVIDWAEGVQEMEVEVKKAGITRLQLGGDDP